MINMAEKMKLWKGNRVDQEYELTPEEIINKFFESQEWRDWKTGNTYSSIYYLFRIFVGSRTGLNSVMEQKDLMKIEAMIRKDKRRSAAFDEILKAEEAKKK